MIPAKVLLTRYGGAGDMIMMEPAIEALYYKHRPVELHLRTHPHYVDLHKFHPLISKIIPGILTAGVSAPGLPSDLKKPEGYDFFYNVTGAVEMNRGIHGMDSFAFATGAPLLRRTPNLYLDPQLKVIPTDIVVHQPKTPRNNDFMNHNVSSEIQKYFSAQGVSVNITTVGESGEVVNGLQQFAATIAGAKLFVGPDSAGAHIAAALNVPSVAAYTSNFPRGIRAYQNTIAVHDNDIDTLVRIAFLAYNKKQVSATSLACLSSRFVVGQEGVDTIILQDLTEMLEWRTILIDIVNKMHRGNRLFLYERHIKYGGFDSLLLVKFMIENLGLSILEYSSFADATNRYYVAAERK